MGASYGSPPFSCGSGGWPCGDSVLQSLIHDWLVKLKLLGTIGLQIPCRSPADLLQMQVDPYSFL